MSHWGAHCVQGWLVRVLKSARVDVINVEAGLIGGDAEAPFSGQVLFEVSRAHSGSEQRTVAVNSTQSQ